MLVQRSSDSQMSSTLMPVTNAQQIFLSAVPERFNSTSQPQQFSILPTNLNSTSQPQPSTVPSSEAKMGSLWCP